MLTLYIIIGALVFLGIIAILTTYICFYITFYVPERKKVKSDEFTLPPGEIYIPYSEQMLLWSEQTKKFPCERVNITSFDGLNLHGRYFEREKGATIEIMFHGYRGNAERDLCGGVQRAFALGRNVLLVDQRASGNSGGKVITFGINERKDCLSWVKYAAERFGKQTKIIMTGISMGAATVLMTSDMDIPENVVGVIADCGYTSPKEIIKKCVKQMGLSPRFFYPFIKLGAKIFGGFNLEETSPLSAMKNCTVPIIFFHGEKDTFVPYEMSEENYRECASHKRFVTMSEAGHGMCYLVEPQRYLEELKGFEIETENA